MKLDIRHYDPEELLIDAAKGLERSDWERALLFYEAAARLGDLNGTARYHWGRLLLSKGRPEDAVKVTQAMRAKDLRVVANRYVLCQALFAARTYGECFSQCQLLLKELNSHSGALNLAFYSLLLERRWAEATAFFEKHGNLQGSKQNWSLYAFAATHLEGQPSPVPDPWVDYVARGLRDLNKEGGLEKMLERAVEPRT